MKSYRATGSMDILGKLYQPYMELVYGVCLKYLKQPEDAQDSTILIFEELRSKLLKHEVENFRPWLYSLARNHCLMRLRSEKKYKTADLDPNLMQSEEELHLNGVLEKEENFRKMNFCMEQLEENQRRVIDLFYLQEKSYNEIAAVTGLEWKQVRSSIQNGRRNLKNCMEQQKEKIFEK